MQKFLILFFVFFSTTRNFAQTPNISWQMSLGGAGTDNGRYGIQTLDGGYIVVGQSNSNNGDVTNNNGGFDYWVVKLNSNGGIQWQKNFGGTGDDIARCVRQSSDGGFLVFGETSSTDGDVTGNHGGSDYWLIKINSLGILQWQKTYGGSSTEIGRSIILTSDGGMGLFGYSGSNDGDVTGNHGGASDFWFVKTDVNGNIQWKQVYGGNNTDEGDIAIQTSDGGYIMSGTSLSNNGDVTGNHGGFGDYWVVKTTSLGVIQWQKCYGGGGDELGREIIQSSDGGYLFVGYSNSNSGDVTGNHGGMDYWVVKTNSTGLIQWQKSLGGTSDDWPYAVIETNTNSFLISGNSQSNNGDVTGNHGGLDYWMVNLSSTGSIVWQKCYGGSGDDESNYSIKQSADFGYLITGRSNSVNGDLTSCHGQTDYWTVKLSGTVGIQENNLLSEFTIHPNPASNFIQLKTESNWTSNNIKITNILGEVVMSTISNSSQNRIDISNLQNGIYFLNIGNSVGYSLKFIKTDF